jgi:TonB family protein
MLSRLTVRLGLAIFSLGELALAQSVSMEREEAAPAVVPSAPVPPKPLPVPARIERPVAVSTPLAYPEGASGEHDVVLLLTIAKDGTVTDASVARGDPPFAEAAVVAAKSWLFHPATRDGVAIASKIQFVVKFVPPEEVPEIAFANEPHAAPVSAPSRQKQKEPETYEVTVTGTRAPIKHELGRAEIHDMPGAFGDAYRAIEALPGVVPIVSGLPYFYVRGAPPGNVGYFFDGVPVPYLYHFAAGPGVLHPAFVDHVDLYPGAYPARYGRFAGAIVAGEMAPPGYRFRGEASIRLIDSGAMLEVPFASGRGSIMAGGRFSYTGLVLSLIVPDVTLNYWDYQTRARYELGAHDSVEVLAFGSGDFLSNKETSTQTVPAASGDPYAYDTTVTKRDNTLVDVGFHRFDLRFDHRLTQGNWRNALMLGLDRTGFDNGNVNVTNRLVGARSEFQQRVRGGPEIRAGADVLFESLAQKVSGNGSSSSGTVATANSTGSATPTDPVTPSSSTNDQLDYGFDRARKDVTAGTWGDLVIDAGPRVQITPGLRLDLYNSGDRVAVGVDPRISARYLLTKRTSIVHGLALAHQAPSFVVPIPGFKPSLEGGLQTAVQHSAGISFPLPAEFSVSATLFQNLFFNMTDYISLAQLQRTANTNGTDQLRETRTTGHAYGAEFMVRRSLSRDLGGFVSYTLSHSVRTSGNLEGPAMTDRTHVVNVAASYDLGRNWRLGGRWLFYSGIPAQVAYLEAAKSPPRTPPFWRIDFKLQKRWYIVPPTAWWGFVFEVLNTTLNKEDLNGSCNAYRCKYESIGPVTVPSIGAEGAF